MRAPLWSAVALLSERRLLTPPTVRLALLKRMARLGLASECGRLFHVTPACDRVAAAMRSPLPTPQQDLFQ